mmetsp:Transcript_41048/g.82822  ORF Transcript_41048/g.82822 Transcript_41048/m.82822 type:complete len:254 (-) Transcript_41048:555-1316(-)
MSPTSEQRMMSIPCPRPRRRRPRPRYPCRVGRLSSPASQRELHRPRLRRRVSRGQHTRTKGDRRRVGGGLASLDRRKTTVATITNRRHTHRNRNSPCSTSNSSNSSNNNRCIVTNCLCTTAAPAAAVLPRFGLRPGRVRHSLRRHNRRQIPCRLCHPRHRRGFRHRQLRGAGRLALLTAGCPLLSHKSAEMVAAVSQRLRRRPHITRGGRVCLLLTSPPPPPPTQASPRARSCATPTPPPHPSAQPAPLYTAK